MSSSVAAPPSQRTEDDAFRAYSLIQSLLNGDGSPFGQSSPLQANEFGSPLQAINTPSQQQAIDTHSKQLTHSTEGFTDTSSRFSEAPPIGSQQSGHRGAVIKEQSHLLLYEEVPVSSRLPNENTFHSMLLNAIEPSPTGGVRGACAIDLSEQANIVGCYANAIQGSYRDAIRDAYKLGMDPFSEHALGARASSVGPWDSSDHLTDLRVHRAERDLWSLLEMLTTANLLADLDDRQCQDNLDVALSVLPVMASIPEHINTAYQADPRLRKGAVVREWIERAVVDRVVEPPVIRSDPYGETLARLSKTRNDRNRSRSSAMQVQSLHPDGQLSSLDGCLLALDGSDQRDQESLLKAIWQLIRSGQITRAHQLAAEHHSYWLAASLQGMSYHHHEPIIVPGADGASSEQVVGTARMGNTRQPIWVKSCLAYSNKLAAAASSWNNNSIAAAAPSKASIGSRSLPHGTSSGASLAALLEMSIFAALSNNTKVLLSSNPLISSWHDRLWVYLKAAHDRDIAAIVHRYRTRKAAFSSLFPGCDETTVSVERHLLDELGASELSHISTGNCISILNKVPPPHNVADVESLVLGMQAAIIEGASGWTHYVQCTMATVLSSASASSSFRGREHLLRIYCHVCIWAKHGPLDDATNFAGTVTDEVMYSAIEAYIDYLIQQKQYSLIAAYAVYLSRSRRIVKYAQLLQSMQASATNDAASRHHLQSTDAQQLEVLQLAKIYFPEEVIEITRTVAERVGETPLMDAEGSSSVSISSGLVVVERASIRAAPPLRQVGPLKIRPRPMKSSFAASSSTVQMPPTTAAVDAHRGHRVSISMEDPRSSAVTAEETQKMEALRWLFLDPQYVLEAVQQANRLAVKLLSAHRQSLRISPIRAIVSDYIPFDAVAVGEALLQLRRDALDDEQAQLKSLQSEGDSMDEVGAAAAMAVAQSSKTAVLLLQMEEDSWKAQVAKLQLWTSLVRSQQDVAVFSRSVEEFEGIRANLISTSTASMVASLGRFRSTIIRTATVAVDSIYSAITCSSSSISISISSEKKSKSTHAGGAVATGYKEVWDLTETSAKQLLLYNLSSLRDSLIQYSSDASVASIAASEWIAIKSLLEVLLQSMIHKNASTGDVFRTHEVVLHDLVEQIDGAMSSCSHHPQTTATAAASVESSAPIIAMLKECIQLVVDVQLGAQLCGVLLYHLLSSSIQVCLTTATVLESLTYDRDAEAWYQRVLKLSELIASEDYSLQLYSILHRDDLESLLLSINTAALALLSRNSSSLMG